MTQGDAEHLAFEAFCESKRLNRSMHPLHLLYLNADTQKALDVFKAGFSAGLDKTREDLLIQSDWERAHDLLNKAGVRTTPKGEMGFHLIERMEALVAVWEPIGKLSAASCHDLRFLCNTPKEVVEAIKAHRAAFRPQA